MAAVAAASGGELFANVPDIETGVGSRAGARIEVGADCAGAGADTVGAGANTDGIEVGADGAGADTDGDGASNTISSEDTGRTTCDGNDCCAAAVGDDALLPVPSDGDLLCTTSVDEDFATRDEDGNVATGNEDTLANIDSDKGSSTATAISARE